jgi:hypothetical protein
MVAVAALLTGVVGVTAGVATSPAGAAPAPSGKVHGHLRVVGGPPPGESKPVPGHVFLRAHGHRVLTMAVGGDGRFHGSVSPGRYHAFGRSPKYGNNKTRCHAAHAIHVHRYQVVHFVVACQEP